MSCGTEIFKFGLRRASVLAIALAAFWNAAGTSLCKNAIDHSTAERLVAESADAQTAGDLARSYSLIRQAIRNAPDYELARWQLGQVNIDGEWMAVEEAQRRAAADPKQAEYHELRSQYGETPRGQLALARWCRKNNLDEEARFHWASVLSVEPSNREAMRELGMRWHNGRLMSRDQIASEKRQSREALRAARQWSDDLARWVKAVSIGRGDAGEKALAEIRKISDPAAIPATEKATLAQGNRDAESREAQRAIGLAFIAALDAMSDQAATESLTRHAVVAPFSDVREAATDRLRYRSLYSFIPMLLDGLRMPIESSFRVETDSDGSVHYFHSLYREGAGADVARHRSHTARQPVSQRRIAARLFNGDGELLLAAIDRPESNAGQNVIASARTYGRIAAQAADTELRAAAENRTARALNERIIATLKSVTGEDLGTEPRDWWDWWASYNEYEVPEERPVYETTEVSYEEIPPLPPQCECFAAGTLVWTKTGQRSIESLELGELVLSQNVETGELTYQPVIGRTVRPPSKILKLSFAGETLRTTRGHPLWISGVGWRMAKELEDGAVLHGIAGAPRLDSLEGDGEEEAYNLVVAEFNTYFVGESGVLVHDNTPRRPTQATIPGISGQFVAR